MLAQGILQGIYTEIIIHGQRDFPRQHITAGLQFLDVLFSTHFVSPFLIENTP